MDNFDALVDSVTTAEPSAPPVPTSAPKASFDSLVDQVSTPDADELHASLVSAQSANPQATATRLKQATQLGIDPELVTADAPAQIRAKLLDAHQIAKSSPATAKFLTKKTNAELAADVVAQLQEMETASKSYTPEKIKRFISDYTATGRQPAEAAQVLTVYKNAGVDLDSVIKNTIGENLKYSANAALFGFNESVYGVGQAAAENIVQPFTKLLAGTILPVDIGAQMADTFRRLRQEEKAARLSNEKARDVSSDTEGAVYSGVQSGLQQLISIPLAILSRNPELMLGGMSAQTGGQAYGEARDKGLGQIQSLTHATSQAAIEYATEKLPSVALLDGLKASKPFLSVAGNFLVKEVGGEQVATVLQDLNDWATLNPEKPFADYLNERPGAAYQTLIATIVGASIQVGAAKGIDLAVRTAFPYVAPTPQQTRFEDVARASRADQAFSTLTTLTEMAANNPTRELSSDAFHEFATAMSENPDSISEVFIDAKTFGEALAANKVTVAELQTKIPEVAAQLEEGLAIGGAVRIALPDYLTYLAPSPVAQAILPHLRVEADGLTYTESQAFFQAQKAEDQKLAEKLAVAAEPVLTREEFEAQALQEIAPVVEAAVGADAATQLASEIVADPEAQQDVAAVVKQTYEQYLDQHPNKAAVLARDVDTVHKAIIGQLQSAGRFPRHINAAYAVPLREFYTQNAKRMGLRPSQLLERLPVKFVAESLIGRGAAFDQPEQAATLADFAPRVVERILTKHNWAILTAANPNNTVLTDAENDARMAQLYEYLDANGIQYTEVMGRYGDDTKEIPSVILYNTTARQALDIGRLFDRQSVLTRDGLIYQNGDVNPSSGKVTDFTAKGVPENNYTRIPDGSVFNVDIDFGTVLKQGEHREIAGFVPQTETPEFKAWFGDSKVVDENGEPLVVYHSTSSAAENFKRWAGSDNPVIDPDEINSYDFSGAGPFVVRAFHGTTHKFTEFNAGLRGNVEGQFGAVNYFTSSEQDAWDNYAGEGPDLTIRIEQKAERLADEITDAYEDAGGSDNDAEAVQALKDHYGADVYDEDHMTMARNIVRKELHGGEENVLEVFIRTDRPFVVGDSESPWFEFFDEAKLEADAIQQVADNNGVSVEDVRSDWDTYTDEIDDARYQLMDEAGNPLVEAVQRVAERYDFDPSDLLASLYDISADGSVRHNTLEEFMRQNESLAYAERPDDGALVQSQMIGEIIQELGFDSIILKHANIRFKGMRMYEDTAHIHVFDANNTNVKSVDNSGQYDPNNPNIFLQTSQGWYFSQLARTIEQAKTDNLPAAQWKAWLTANAPKFGVKKDEMQYTGIGEWLDLQQGKISKAQIADYLNSNGVQVVDVMLGAVESGGLPIGWAVEESPDEEGFWEVRDAEGVMVGDGTSREAALRSAGVHDARAGTDTQYSTYTVPGGTNYKELLLTLPNTSDTYEARVYTKDGLSSVYEVTDNDISEFDRNGRRYEILRRASPKGAFRSAHWEQPNILAHVRFDERVDADGNRVLFINEIQSDWGQKGKKEGFALVNRPIDSYVEKTADGWMVLNRNGNAIASVQTEERAREIAEREMGKDQAQGVPSAPFVTDTKAWVALALKRMIAYAAENNFDKVAIISGQQAADLYDLSKSIGSVEAKDYAGGVTLNVFGLGGRYLQGKHFDTYDDAGIEDYIGKDMARKIAEDRAAVETPAGDYNKNYSGLDLKVGGEGMRAFYDQIVPQVANDVLKKIGGGKVESLTLPGDRENDAAHSIEQYAGEFHAMVGKEEANFKTWQEANTWINEKLKTVQLGFTITPEMKAKVADGLPLFQQNLGSFDPNSLTVSLLNGANLSTVLHESGHFYLRALELMSAMPEATQEMKDDFDATLKWFGIADRATWAAMSVDQQRPYHEQWAQSQERWMLEGKSPSLEMQPIFARFRAWLLNVYKSVELFLQANPLAGNLNDEIRGVFSRLIASEEAIGQAEAARNYTLLFSTEEEAKAQGVPAAEYREYVKQYQAAHNDSVEALQQRSLRDMKWLSNAKSRAVRELQRTAATLRKGIREETAKAVLMEPINLARNFLRTGETTDPNTGDQIKLEKGYKLNTEALQAMYPISALGNPDVSKLRGMTSPEGLDPEIVAQMFGFPSGDALVRELIDGENPKDKIEGLTDQRMLEEHGELVDQRAIEEAANEAVHNDARARFMATGLKMLTKSPISSYQLSKAAQEAAENAVAKKRVRDLRPGQYTAAETRANKEVLAKVATDPKKAADAQRTALLNNRLAKATLEAQAEVKKLVKYVSKFRNEGTRKALDLEYLEQIDQLLAAFDANPSTTLRELDQKQSLAAWVAEHEKMSYEPTLDPEKLAEQKRTHYKEMTVEELRGFVDAIKEIEHYGRQKKKLLTALDARAFAERMAEADASIRENANRTVPERGTPHDVVGSVGKFGRGIAANHRKFSSFLREMDASRDNGVMWNLLGRTMNDAGARETEMRAEANAKVAALFEPIRKDISKTIVPGNLYARKMVVPGTNLSMTLEERIMFALNMGNEGNLQRLLDGGITGVKAISQADARAVLNTLTKEQLDFVQGIWDYFDTFRPAVAELERELTGKTPQWVEPLPLATEHGTYRGGYFPAKYDAMLSTRSESLEAATNLRQGMKGAFGAAAARNGYTKERSAQVVGRPLLLSFNAISQHVNEVTHRLAWQPWLIDANRALRALDGVIREHYGAEVLGEMRKTVVAIAQGDAPASNEAERFINRVRTGSTIVGLGWRFTTALMQPSGLAQSWSRVGGSWVAKGVSQYLAAPFETTAWVQSQSDFMKNRASTINREINEILNGIRAGEKLTALEASYFNMIGKMQTTVDIPTWLGARERSLAEQGYENAASAEERARMEKTAIAVADQAVIDSQSDGAVQNLAGVQRGGPMWKLWTNFYSYFSATYNLNVEAYRRTDFSSPSEIGLFLGDMVLLNMVPVLFASALAQLTKGECDWDDTECLLGAYAHQQLSYLFGQMILLRELGSAADVWLGGKSYGYSGPAGQRFFADLYKLGVQANQGEADMAAFKAANAVLGAVLHYPAGQINNTVEGIMAVENGDVEGVAIVPAILFGPPR